MTIEELEMLQRPALVSLWKKEMEADPPKGISRSLLLRSLAWQVQANAKGGLSQRTRKQLRTYAEAQAKMKLRRVAKPGTRLVREWNGVSHVVDVTDQGPVYLGQTYSSLTAVARHITGAHWSGPRFFGLR